MNYLALLSVLVDSLHAWGPIFKLNSFSAKMLLIHFVSTYVTIEILNYYFKENFRNISVSPQQLRTG